MKKVIAISLLTFAVMALLFAEPAMAGPGGKILNAAFETPLGRIALVILTLLFLPLILYTLIKEKLAERRAQKDLAFMAKHSPLFAWLNMQERAKDCFFRVHRNWEQEDLSQVSDWMDDWYLKNQQLVYLDKWKNLGLVNICEVKKILKIKPLLFMHRNDGAEHGNSKVVIAITARMKDYLQDRQTGKVMEGSKNFKDATTLWTLTLTDGVWKVSDIEEDSMSLAYAKMVKDLPGIETTLVRGGMVA